MLYIEVRQCKVYMFVIITDPSILSKSLSILVLCGRQPVIQFQSLSHTDMFLGCYATKNNSDVSYEVLREMFCLYCACCLLPGSLQNRSDS